MLKSNLIKIMIYIGIFLFISSSVYSSDTINSAASIDAGDYFIIDNDVNLYKENESSEIVRKVNFFEQVSVFSDDVSSKGRVKIKLQDGTKGWIEEIYISFIPKDWKKLSLIENFFCYIPTVKKINIKKDEGDDGKMYYYSNNDINIAIGVNLLSGYKQDYDFRQFIIKREIQGGHDKKFNWNREFTIGHYRVNYVITTDHPEGGISESFDFVKLDEMNLKKCYTVGIDYMPYDSAKKKLMWRKILFSTLQSLK